jgi:hypothetical protein
LNAGSLTSRSTASSLVGWKVDFVVSRLSSGVS